MSGRVSLAFVFLASASCWAGQVDRARVTLGALTDEADAVVVGSVASVDSRAGAVIQIAQRLKGVAPDRLVLASPSPELGLTAGERVALFLRRDARGALTAPPISWAKVSLATAGSEAEVVAAIRSRLPQVVVAEEDERVDPLRSALFGQLNAATARVRADAAHDLKAFRRLAATPAERGRLATALARPGRVATPLLELAERLPDPRHQPALITIARSAASAQTRALAGRALAKLDVGAARETFRIELNASRATSALAAVRGLGALRDEASAGALVPALSDRRVTIQRAALAELARARPQQATTRTAITRLAESATDPTVQRRALATLAACGAGKALARLAQEGATPELRALAERLRRDPVRASRQLLAD